jgi:hypothetical protein
MGAAKVSSKPGNRSCIHRYRYLGDKRVMPVQQGSRMIGYVDGQAVCGPDGRELNFKQIGELRVPVEEPKAKK